MNNPFHSTRSAFTLIEMMIALGLGMLIVYTAVAGFRTASQTITSANRLSLENSLLRAGYFEAQIQLDFWTNLDDPTLPASDRPMNKVDSGKGLPFVSMRTIMPVAAGTGSSTPRSDWSKPLNGVAPRLIPLVAGRTARSVDAWENDIGWDPSYSFAIHDPRTWNRANLAEKERHREGNPSRVVDQPDSLPPFYFGRYAIFANVQDDPTNGGTGLYSYKIKPDMNALPSADPMAPVAPELKPVTLTYSAITPTSKSGVHTWYYRQVKYLMNCVGYAGFCEYMPPNSLYTFYEPYNSSNTNEGGIHKITSAYWSPWNQFNNDDGSQRTSRGIYRQTYSRSFGYINPRAPEDLTAANPSAPPLGVLRGWHYRNYLTNHNASSGSGSQEMNQFIARTAYKEALMGSKPEYWPQTEAAVGRFIKNARHVALAKISMMSPLSGHSLELTWTGLGTSLRGARQQRHQTAGWARWDNGGGSSDVDPNLDTP